MFEVHGLRFCLLATGTSCRRAERLLLGLGGFDARMLWLPSVSLLLGLLNGGVKGRFASYKSNKIDNC